MRGDFSRDTFDPKSNFTRVLMQQGRLIVDADWNEQSSIILKYVQTLAADLIGWHGGPGPNKGGFEVQVNSGNIEFRGGRYYVDGLAISIEEFNPDGEWYRVAVLNADAADPAPNNRLVYLDVWEGSGLDDQLIDPAFAGLDTIVRVQLKWAVRAVKIGLIVTAPELTDRAGFRTLQYPVKTTGADLPTKIDSRAPETEALPKMAAWTAQSSGPAADCNDENAGGFSGTESQLYRVEIHRGGKTLWDGRDATNDDSPTFKWSRENASVVYRVKSISLSTSSSLTLATSWRDDRRAIKSGNWIEIVALDEDSGVLVQAEKVEKTNQGVVITFKTDGAQLQPTGKYLVRRWDHRKRQNATLSEGAIVIAQAETGKSPPIPLEDGITIQFQIPTNAEFRSGDYWLIPARAATGDILWPRDLSPPGGPPASPRAIVAQYAKHHYAPLALIPAGTPLTDLRKQISTATG